MYRRRRSQSGDALQDWYFAVQQTILAYQVTVYSPHPQSRLYATPMYSMHNHIHVLGWVWYQCYDKRVMLCVVPIIAYAERCA